ncbi:protein of unknown function [Blastococcus saxobsidens DD2]|uniref:Uncharacterized protein n=1 Tax=Blastococcus saxobsidens (strain DD2) TaxID=1146883 RepID=H6RTJ4_BLASD|nr:protein of unknown function [Blastococcus saxobsidens DD2]
MRRPIEPGGGQPGHPCQPLAASSSACRSTSTPPGRKGHVTRAGACGADRHPQLQLERRRPALNRQLS